MKSKLIPHEIEKVRYKYFRPYVAILQEIFVKFFTNHVALINTVEDLVISES